MSARRAAVAALALALAAPADAYVRSTSDTTGAPLFWPNPAVPYVVSSASAFHSPSCTPASGADPALDAVRASFSTWEQSCSSLQLVYSGRIDATAIGLHTEGEHLVVFRRGFCSANAAAAACMNAGGEDCGNTFDCFEDWGTIDPAHPDRNKRNMTRNVVALTSVLYGASSGRIVDADIEVNGWDGQGAGTSLSGPGGPPRGWYFTCLDAAGLAQCTTYGERDCFYMDLRNTVTHEVGHFIGLAHVCETADGNCTPALRPITMFPGTFPGDAEKRTLDEDDIDGVCAVYPERSGSSDDGGGCASAGGAPAASALLLAAAALWRRRRGR